MKSAYASHSIAPSMTPTAAEAATPPVRRGLNLDDADSTPKVGSGRRKSSTPSNFGEIVVEGRALGSGVLIGQD